MITCKFEDGGEGKLRHVTVHGLVINDNKLLLVKRSPKIIEGGKWGLPGGFINRDETLEQAVLREVMEETGWECEVKKMLRINSDPYRRNDNERQNIAIDFLLTPLKESGSYDWEQTEIKWWDLNEIEPESLAFDHGESIDFLKSHLESSS